MVPYWLVPWNLNRSYVHSRLQHLLNQSFVKVSSHLQGQRELDHKMGVAVAGHSLAPGRVVEGWRILDHFRRNSYNW
jgi:hypothetical protein